MRLTHLIRRGGQTSAVLVAVGVIAILVVFQPRGIGDRKGDISQLPVAVLTPRAEDSFSATAPTLTGRPTHITDGDTFRFGETRIRIMGMNAPEMDTENGPPARRALIDIIGSGVVQCADTGQRSYKRIVAVCYDEHGRDLAERMVRAGWATDLPRYSGGRYAEAERIAKAEGRGVHGR